jgi:hypothetical protein
MLPSVPMRTTSAPTTSPLSRLNHTACTLAVYASQRGLPQRHARLASDCRSALPGRIDCLPGPGERFHAVVTDPYRNPPFPGFPWRTRTPGTGVGAEDPSGESRSGNIHQSRAQLPFCGTSLIGKIRRTSQRSSRRILSNIRACSADSQIRHRLVRLSPPKRRCKISTADSGSKFVEFPKLHQISCAFTQAFLREQNWDCFFGQRRCPDDLLDPPRQFACACGGARRCTWTLRPFASCLLARGSLRSLCGPLRPLCLLRPSRSPRRIGIHSAGIEARHCRLPGPSHEQTRICRTGFPGGQ